MTVTPNGDAGHCHPGVTSETLEKIGGRTIVKPSSQPLRPSPYLVRRDPATGQWLVIQPNAVGNTTNDPSPHSGDSPPEPSGCP
jgi:hypothetical protein